MKKIKDFMRKPVTWGDYLKLCLVALVVGIVELAWVYETYFGWISGLTEAVKDKMHEYKLRRAIKKYYKKYERSSNKKDEA